MSTGINKTAAQTLFERVIATWIRPEVEKRAQGLAASPFNLAVGLIVWDDLSNPKILLNDEADSSILELKVNTVSPISPSQPVNASTINGLRSIRLVDSLRSYPFLFLLLANQNKYYLLSKKMSRVVHTRDFEVLKQQLATEGLKLGPESYEVTVYLDATRNLYDYQSTPAGKRREAIRLAETYTESYKRTVMPRVKRHLRLPHLLVHQDDEFLPLLYETRQTYIDGHFFSCVASAATTADRICIRLSQWYGLPRLLQKWVVEQTLGNKIQKLRSEGVITKDQEDLLVKINEIRNRHIHPNRPLRALTLKRDAFIVVCLLHELVEGTFSIYRDHTFKEGVIVPKPLV